MAFVIVTCNSERYLQDCIASLRERCRNYHTTVVVVDNASTDNSLAIAKAYEGSVVIPLPENLGFGAANNVACSAVKADYYFLINPDAWLGSEFDFEKVFEGLIVNREIGICGVRLAYPDGASQTSSFSYSSPGKWLLQTIPCYGLVARTKTGRGFVARLMSLFSRAATSYSFNHADYKVDYSIVDVDWVSGAAMIVSQDFINRFGLFDENIFLYGEDEDLCIRVRQNGYRVTLMNTQPVFHVHGWNSGGRSDEKILNLKYISLAYFIDKHFRQRFSWVLMRFLLPVRVYGFRGWWVRGKKAFRNPA